jgi:hypothetical protein
MNNAYIVRYNISIPDMSLFRHIVSTYNPRTVQHKNISRGGNLIYKGGDVIEYRMAQAGLAKWTNYMLDLTKSINQGWPLKPGDMLESVYIVVEAIGQTTVTVKVDDLWIVALLG